MKHENPRMRRRLLIPEVVQTSATDCGPAALKCLLEGFHINVSYGRLREACQTSIDGTSLDTLEKVAGQLGLDAEQIMLPPEHLLVLEAKALPAIVVVRLPHGFTHFAVAWRRHLGAVQIMDPATGRRWMTCRNFESWLYIHTIAVSAAAWREWAASEEFLGLLRRNLAHLSVSNRSASRILRTALSDTSWRSLAGLHAVIRMAESIVRAGGLRRGAQSAKFTQSLFEQMRRAEESFAEVIARPYWPVLPAAQGDNEENLLMRGAVLVRVRGLRVGRRTLPQQHIGDNERAAMHGEIQDEQATMAPELVAALEEPPTRPALDFLKMLRADGLLTPVVLVKAIVLATAAVIVQIVMFRSLLDIGTILRLGEQRVITVGALAVFLLAVLMLNLPIAAGLLQLGRHLEVRLRAAFLEKVARISDRYFHSRPVSDMAERCHSIQAVRLLPSLAGQILKGIFELVLTTAGIIWLVPASAPLAVTAAVLSVCLPLIVLPLLAEREMRVLNHSGALSRFYLDAMLGLMPVRAHAAERAVRTAHERLLAEWARAGIALQRAVITVDGLQFIVGFALAFWLLILHAAQPSETGSLLLLAFWTLNLPSIGSAIALAARQYPLYRNLTVRLLEPLGAPEETLPPQAEQPPMSHVATNAPNKSVGAVDIAMEGVSLKISGRTILEGVDLFVEAGSHVAIVGASGAGKSSLVGLLLGWNKPSSGRILVDRVPLDGERLRQLRQEIAWVDPLVQLWNCSLADNLRYGAPPDSLASIGQIIEAAELRSVLENLPDGLQTPLGENGALVSGGEGQRVRLGRALMRRQARLVILDEPFTALERPRREKLLAAAREVWRGATLLYVTHDLAEAAAFQRVLVVETGRIVEDGAPADLIERASRYRELLESERAVRKFMSNEFGRRMQINRGLLAQGRSAS